MFRVCAVHKFQSHLANQARDLENLEQIYAITTRAHLHRQSSQLLHEHTFVVLLPNC